MKRHQQQWLEQSARLMVWHCQRHLASEIKLRRTCACFD